MAPVMAAQPGDPPPEESPAPARSRRMEKLRALDLRIGCEPGLVDRIPDSQVERALGLCAPVTRWWTLGRAATSRPSGIEHDTHGPYMLARALASSSSVKAPFSVDTD